MGKLILYLDNVVSITTLSTQAELVMCRNILTEVCESDMLYYELLRILTYSQIVIIKDIKYIETHDIVDTAMVSRKSLIYLNKYTEYDLNNDVVKLLTGIRIVVNNVDIDIIILNS